MELTYNALENAGYDSLAFRGRTGLYVSFDNGAYVWNNIIHSGEDWFDAYQLNKVHIATRAEKIAYKFDFRGPAVMSEYAELRELIEIDSPVGYTDKASQYVVQVLRRYSGRDGA